mgnify:FL=1
MKKITYIFGGGRLEKINDQDSFAKDFYYGFHLLNNNKKYDTKILEIYPFTKSKTKYLSILQKIDILLTKLIFLQFHFHEIYIKENLKRIKNSDLLIFSNDRLAFSFFPILKFNKNIKSIVFVMGLLKEHENLKIYQKILRPFFLSIFIKTVDKFIFLGKSEYEFALKKYPQYEEKFIFISFAVDYNFWNLNKKKTEKINNQILFIGNDGNRNYDFIKELPKFLPEFNFIIISDQIKDYKEQKNVNFVAGNWSKGYMSDKELSKFYSQSFLTILPIKNTIQPSGQSVALQSMATGTPVLISKFDGFWEKDIFINDKNIFFIEHFKYDDWAKLIRILNKNPQLIEKVSLNGKDLIKNKYNLETFVTKIEKLIETIT